MKTNPLQWLLYQYQAGLRDAGLCVRSTTLGVVFIVCLFSVVAAKNPIAPVHAGDFSLASMNSLRDLEKISGSPGAVIDYRNAVAFMQHRNPALTEQDAQAIFHHLQRAAREFNLPEGLLFFLADVESDYRLDAVSHKGSLGLMQVNPFVWVHKQHTDNLVTQKVIQHIGELFTAEGSLRASAYILRHYMDRALQAGSKSPAEDALRCYLGGTSNNHPKNFRQALGDYILFSYNLGQERLLSQVDNLAQEG
ncbi:MAG: transglycosylase SLT domain-containing protein [Candidatus Cloacimonetes bacterium]|nr:transglycosylase SLT domain-containing protein [Candidatus Cloacimonadota bacterium]MDY0171623.1 transglycosylase SLT domain-containing protein [Candidatus Cloacimonadaceae bacterium]